MRIYGYNLVAILAAAIVIYAVGYIIYGVLIPPDVWMKNAGVTPEEMNAISGARMIYGPLMPLATAVGMAVLFRWASVGGLHAGLRYGALVALFSAIPAIWYGWVYGVGGATDPLIDSAHLLVGHMVAGSVLATWK
jgi:hypothetical protein